MYPASFPHKKISAARCLLRIGAELISLTEIPVDIIDGSEGSRRDREKERERGARIRETADLAGILEKVDERNSDGEFIFERSSISPILALGSETTHLTSPTRSTATDGMSHAILDG